MARELIAERRAKAQRPARGATPSAFPAPPSPESSRSATILAAYEHLEAGEETDERHRVAGRIAARRGAGKAAFLDLVDRSGKIQLHARAGRARRGAPSSACSRSTSAT